MPTRDGKFADSYAKYRAEVAKAQVLGSLRAGILVVVGLHLPFLVLDHFVYPYEFSSLVIARVSNAVSLGVVYAFARRNPERSMLIASLIAGFHLIAVIGIAGGVSSLYFPGLMLLFLGMPVLLPLTTRQSVFLVSVLFASFAGLPLVGWGEFGTQDYLVNLFFPGAAAIESVFSCALLDRLRFRDFERREEIAAARDQLEMLDDAKSRFSANVHHELRTPLTLMLAPLDGLKSGDYGEVSDTSRPVLETMHSNGARLLKLINNLLDLSKLENQQFSVNRQPIELADFIDGLVDGTQGFAEKKGLVVEATPSKGLPSICADRDALDKIMINLVGNAMKFTEPGGRVVVESEVVDGGVQLRVVDTGVGLAPEHLERIFDRFAQVDCSATRKHEGTGIGLSLACELVELHGGRLWAESDGLECGTTMCVFLPYGKPDISEVPFLDLVEAGVLAGSESELEAGVLDDDRRRPDGLSIPFAEFDADVQRWTDHQADSSSFDEDRDFEADSPFVLVVDDNADMRDLLKFILGKEFSVRTARNGLEALEVIRQVEPMLVVTDVMMPEMSGTELCAAIKENETTRDVPVMIVSSKAEGEMKARGLELGADDYVTKPFHPREVLARSRSLVSLRRAQLGLAERNSELEVALSELRDAQHRLVQSERLAAVGEMAAGVAHEVNNPVNFALNAARTMSVSVGEVNEVATAASEFLAKNEVLSPTELESLRNSVERLDPETWASEIRELARITTDGLERTQKLVGDLRDFASPRPPSELSRIDLSVPVSEAVSLMAHEYSRAGVDLCFEELSEQAIVLGDVSSIGQVVVNLLKNALDAVCARDPNDSSVAREVVLSVHCDGDEIAVTVSDSGLGFSDEVSARLFDPFFTTKPAGKGTGLGLAMCKGIAEAHRGRLTAESSDEGGAEFVLFMPRVA